MMSTDGFNLSNPSKPTIVKDPAAILDYSWDWSNWLAAMNDTIAAATVTANDPSPTPLTVQSVDFTSVPGVVTAVLAGGQDDTLVSATCQVTTAGGLVDERTFWFRVRQR